MAGGAGLKDEEVELTGDASTDEGESMQSAESKEEVELLRLFLRNFIHGCSRHFAAVIRFLRACVRDCGLYTEKQHNHHIHTLHHIIQFH